MSFTSAILSGFAVYWAHQAYVSAARTNLAALSASENALTAAASCQEGTLLLSR
ncbi:MULTISPECIES: hypothetical protein [Pseudomonas]|nr:MULTISPECIES: hypothetical protein [Pseudomonas]MCW2291213.1 hypothetical protein [Pseudomonas sp. BIGb0408]NYH74216.1 hypothetical protein [Pseudomonas flavescens]